MKKAFIILLGFLVSAIRVYAQNTDTESKITDYFYQGYNYIYSQKDSAYYYFDEALALAEETNDYESQFQILSYKIYTNGYHYDMSEYLKNLKRVEQLLEMDSISKKVAYIKDYRQQFIFDSGNYHYKLKEYAKAKPYFIKISNQLSGKDVKQLSAEEINTLSSTYNFLASIYKNTDKFDLAELYYNEAKTLSEEIYKGADLAMARASVDQLLAQLYNDMGELDKANQILESTLETYLDFHKNDKKYKNNLISVYQTLVDNCIAREEYDKAIEYLGACEKIMLPNDAFYKKSLVLYGIIYSKQQKDSEALEYYNAALAAYQEYRQFRLHQDIAGVYGEFSKFYLNKGEYQKGLSHIDNAIKASGAMVSDSIRPSKAFSKRQLLDLLDLKNQLCLSGFKKTQNPDYLKKAIATNRTILETFRLLKMEFESKLDKQFLSSTVYPVFNRMMEITFESYNLEPKKKLLDLALNISEKNKDILLLEAIRDLNATKFNNVPESILQREVTYKNTINTTEKRIFNSANSDRLKALNDTLFQQKDDYYKFLDSLAQNYPTYYNLKYDEPDILIEQLKQEVLQGEATLVSYTMTQGFLYIIALSNSGEKFLRVPFSQEKTKDVETFYSLICKPSLTGSEQLQGLSKKLYDVLLQEALMGSKEKELIIIPDGILHYIPFELLMDNNGDYLVSSKRISYNGSITSLMELKRKTVENNGELLAFAPLFATKASIGEERFELGPLLHNKREVRAIGDHFDTTSFLDAEASLDNFYTNARQFNIIHLATHSSANDEFPDYSYLAFSKADSISMLYIKDLYNTQINAGLVTLSACQTGIGKLQKGSGMISLSKGFYYAGAKSLVKSLWKINDRSTATLMDYFYEELSDGKTKDEALRQAKLRYLNSVDDELLKHPYYWGAFVVSGDTVPITDHNHVWWFVLFGIVVLGSMVFALKRKTR
ncbi:MAG: hypothetical protein CMH46_07420 [Muricauda sp.]|nr:MULTISPECIES: CHAT domain-containing tetratricopeptide repeat protein [unclassified Allomuricauda]MAU15353.1 hypothetical protein [Allomuricauda sp.]|tara:strand:+ start:3312 stop:6143 length:2832 start_codon:yes stop_codon:yes gene_type:complete